MTGRTSAAILSGALLLAGGRLDAGRQTFVARAEFVRVDALVTDGNRVVPDLRADDFEILDNGVPQAIQLVAFENLPVNLVLALDISGSVAGDKITHLRAAATSALGHLKPDDKAGLVAFASLMASRVGLTRDVGDILASLQQPSYMTNTALVDAAYAAMILSESEPGRPLVLIFSDGLDTSSFLTPAGVLDTARRSEAVVYAISAAAERGTTFLHDLCDVTGGRQVDVGSTRELSQTFVTLLDEFRQRYLLSYSPTGVPKGGWHRLEVKVKNRRAKVKARQGYFRE